MSDVTNSNSGQGVVDSQPAADIAEYMALSNESTTAGAGTATAPAVDGTTTGNLGEASQDGKAPPLSGEDITKLEREVEQALADEKTPKWFTNAVKNVYEPKLDEYSKKLSAFEPLETYGDVAQIVQGLEMLKGLETIRSNPNTGMPERSTEPFVKSLYEREPETAYQLIDDLCKLPSPYTQGYTILQEIFGRTGIDPAQVDAIKQFAANGYRLTASQYPPPTAEELEDIPVHLRPTYAQLSPDEREELTYLSPHNRDTNLENAKFKYEQEGRQKALSEQEEQRKTQERQQQEFQFKQQVNTKAAENFSKAGETVFTSFVDSLSKQAGLSKMDSLMITNTVLNSFENTLAGRQSAELLKAEGIEIDPVIASTITALEENSAHIAYYELTGDKANVERLVAKQVELQERLTAKGNKIIASLAGKRSQSDNGQTPDLNLNLEGTPATIQANANNNFDFSEEGYSRLIAESGGFSRNR